MIDLTKQRQGNIGVAIRFSDVFASAVSGKLTGAVLVRAEGAPQRLAFFDQGQPCATAIVGPPEDPLGLVLLEMGLVARDAVEAAVAAQRQQPEAQRALLGQILIRAKKLDEATLARAIRRQNEKRLARMFATEGGTWASSVELAARVRAIALPLDGWKMLLPMVKRHASDVELLDVANALLGRSVQLRGDPDVERLGADDDDRRLMALLGRPRKPDQLERALLSRRRVRGALKVLGICGYVDILPAQRGVPIKSTINVQAPSIAPVATRGVSSIGATPPPAEAATPDSAPSQPAAVVPDSPLVRELRLFHGRARQETYFQLLGVEEGSAAADLRQRYTALAKKYHPDAFAQEPGEDVQQMASAVAAILNDAYKTLDDPEKRAEYVARRKASDAPGRPQASEAQLEAARVKWQMGIVYMKKGEFKSARDCFHFATANAPDDGRFKGYYAWSMWADRAAPPESRKTALDLAMAAMRLNTDDVQVFFYCGKIFQGSGEDVRARGAFEKVLALDIEHEHARVALRELGVTPPPAPAKQRNADLPTASSAAPPGKTKADEKKKKKKKQGYEPETPVSMITRFFKRD